MPDNIAVDKVVGHDIYAKATVDAYDGTFKNVKKVFTNGQLIGNVWSWVIHDGEVWYAFYLTPYDYNNFNGTYVKHDASKISLPDLPGILQEIQDKEDAEKRERLGTIAYYIEKYAPWIVGGVVVAVAAPAILNSGKRNVGAMTEDKKNLIGIAATGVLIYFLTKKKKPADIIIGDPYDGQFPDPITGELPPTNQNESTNNNPGTVVVSPPQQLIQYVGPFAVSYKQSGGLIAGTH